MSRPPSRILLLSASAGAGHVRAAGALEEAARRLHPGAQVRHLDVLGLVSAVYRKAYAGGFLRMVDTVPALWGVLYEKSDARKADRARDRLARLYDRVEFAAFREAVRGFAPDLVLSTHFLPAQVFAPYRKKGRDAFPLGLVVTDFDVHAFWVQPAADRFYVATDELRAILRARGIGGEKVAVTGIPVSASFAAPRDRAALRAGLGIPDGSLSVLVMGGGAGVGSLADAVRTVLSLPGVSVLAVAGRNAGLKAEMEALPVPQGARLRVFGFVETIADLMAAADVAVTKSGGLTTAECLASGLPMLVRDPIPGQEERNAEYVVEAGAGWRAHGLERLRFKLGRLVAEPALLARMRAAALSAGRPHAAEAVLEDAGVHLLGGPGAVRVRGQRV